MTIYDVAERAKVSASTVSRVINNKPGVSEKKRKEIKKILDELHYEPDENAQNLVKQKTNVIGILTDDLNSRHQNNAISRIQNTIMEGGYYCFVKYIGVDEKAVTNAIIDMARKRVEGVLLLGVAFHHHAPLQKAISRYLSNVPVVLVHQTESINLPNVYSVGADEKKGFRSCVKRMVQRGRKNLLLMVDSNRTSEDIICESFNRAVGKYSGVQGRICTDVHPTREGAEQAMKQMLLEYPEVDGVICAQDILGIGTVYALQDAGKKVPEEVSVLGEDNSQLCDACRPKLSSMDPMLNLDTVMSAQVLLDVLRGINRNRSVILEMEIVDRETL